MKQLIQNQPSEVKIQKEAIVLLHKAAEQFVAECFMKAKWCADHVKRKTVQVEDFQVVRTISKAKM